MDSKCSETAKKRKIPTRVAGPLVLKKEPCQVSLASLDILNKYGNGLKRLNKEKLKEPASASKPCYTSTVHELSTEEIIKVARARFLRHNTQRCDDISLLVPPFSKSLCGNSYEVLIKVELVEILLASAEKVSDKQFDHARKLLGMCKQMSSATGNPLERVVHYFTEALSERINRETGKFTKEGDKRNPMEVQEEAMTNLKPAFVTCLEKLPFCQVTQFTNIQAILDSVSSAKRIHLVDLGIRSGMQWTVLMQALAVRYDCPLEHLKLTAIGTPRQSIKETGDRLVSFAETMNIPFSFRTVVVQDLADLKEGLFELEAGEVVAIYSAMILSNMLAWPSRLETLMGVLRNLRPSVMVVAESELNTNELPFVDRFIEALSFYGVLFDCIGDCMDVSDPCRITTELELFGRCIQNMVIDEGEERLYRHVKIDAWREYFARFGMVETELSSSSIYQVNLLIKNFGCGSSYSIDFDGKCLLLGWKGTPLHSISAWKMHRE